MRVHALLCPLDYLFVSVSRLFPGDSSSLRSVAGLEDVLDESCGIDVEDELAPELDDNPGRTRGTKLSVLSVFMLCLVNCGFSGSWQNFQFI